MTEKYNADLANGLGNLVSRVIKLVLEAKLWKDSQSLALGKPGSLIEKMELSHGLDYIWEIIKEDNKFIEDNKPWELAKIIKKNFKK